MKKEQFKTFGPYPFLGTARGAKHENRAAHGCCRYVDVRRRDGWVRQRNVNGPHEEVGAWFEVER